MEGIFTKIIKVILESKSYMEYTYLLTTSHVHFVWQLVLLFAYMHMHMHMHMHM